MKLHHMSVAGAVVLSVLVSSAGAVDGPPPTLNAVIEAALERHPRASVHAAHEQKVEALSQRASSLVAGRPSLDVMYKTDQVGSGDGFREWEAGVTLPLWKPGQRDAETRVANDAALAVGQHERGLRLEVAGEVREQVWDTALMKNNLKLAAEERDAAAALEKSVSRRVELGEIARSDLLLARDSSLGKQAAYLRAEKVYNDAMRRYRTFTGVEHLPRQRGETPAADAAVSDDHPLLAEAAAAVQEARTRTASVRHRSGGTPELFVGGSGERGTSDEDFNNRLGFIVSVPIGTRAAVKPEIADAELVLAEAQAEYATRARQLQMTFDEARQEMVSVEEEYQLARQQNELAQQSMHMARVAFDAGERSLLELLRVQSLAFAAQRREQELKITRQRAIARFNQAAGVLP